MFLCLLLQMPSVFECLKFWPSLFLPLLFLTVTTLENFQLPYCDEVTCSKIKSESFSTIKYFFPNCIDLLKIFKQLLIKNTNKVTDKTTVGFWL